MMKKKDATPPPARRGRPAQRGTKQKNRETSSNWKPSRHTEHEDTEDDPVTPRSANPVDLAEPPLSTAARHEQRLLQRGLHRLQWLASCRRRVRRHTLLRSSRLAAGLAVSDSD